MRRYMISAGILAVMVGLCAVGIKKDSGGGMQSAENTLTIVSFSSDAYLRKVVEEYNRAQSEYCIEVLQYERSEDPQADGVLRLQREIAAGAGPDLIDFGIEYSTADIAGKYTEDLFAYLDREEYFENILESFSYQQGLYAAPLGFSLQSFVGAKDNLGNRSSWTIREMMACYGAQRNEKMLYILVIQDEQIVSITEHYVP